ncbi:hypothetical protein KCP69_26875 (plasmid) [Salmonella enterica subsp. enterica]|nr:hypothetical protein KCP69_26875 [Salmonella enterica subsp. enterica]
MMMPRFDQHDENAPATCGQEKERDDQQRLTAPSSSLPDAALTHPRTG